MKNILIVRLILGEKLVILMVKWLYLLINLLESADQIFLEVS